MNHRNVIYALRQVLLTEYKNLGNGHYITVTDLLTYLDEVEKILEREHEKENL